MIRRLKSKPAGLIAFFGLSEWYVSLPPEYQEKVKEYYAMGMNTDPKRVDTGEVSSTGSSQNFLANIGGNAVRHKDYDFAETVLTQALSVRDDNPVDRHFVYNNLIDLYYKLRSQQPDALETCLKYCLADMSRIDAFIAGWRNQYAEIGSAVPDREPELPRIPSFQRSAIIFEKQGNYKAAIAVCNKAIELGLKDKSKGGFPGRLSRLEKKQAKQSS